MTKQEYKEKLAVRNQLSQLDRIQLLEYEMDLLIKSIPSTELKKIGILRPEDSTAAVLD